MKVRRSQSGTLLSIRHFRLIIATYRAADWEDPEGNYEFIVYAEDRNEPGKGNDRIWLQVRDELRNIVSELSLPSPAMENTEELDGGNIVSPHGGGGKPTRKR